MPGPGFKAKVPCTPFRQRAPYEKTWGAIRRSVKRAVQFVKLNPKTSGNVQS